jgi:hypothetical protein
MSQQMLEKFRLKAAFKASPRFIVEDFRSFFTLSGQVVGAKSFHKNSPLLHELSCAHNILRGDWKRFVVMVKQLKQLLESARSSFVERLVN